MLKINLMLNLNRIYKKHLVGYLIHKIWINKNWYKKYLINIRNTNYEANFHAKAFITGGHK